MTQAQDKVLTITGDISDAPVGRYLYLLDDRNFQYSDNQILSVKDFHSSRKDIPVMDVIKGNLWGRLTVVNRSPDSVFFLNLKFSNISKIGFYRARGQQLEEVEATGNDYGFEHRTNTNTDFAFPLRLRRGDTATYYLKIRSVHPLMLPLFIKSKIELDETSNQENLFFGLYFGIIAAILLYNLFLFISTKDKSYFFYIIYLLFLGLAQTTVSGYGFKYLWPHTPQINRYGLTITSCIASITAILFAIFFLRVTYYYKKSIFLLGLAILLYGTSMVASFAGDNYISYNIINYAGLFSAILLIVISLLIARKGYKTAYIYLGAWIFFLAGYIVLKLRNLNIAPYTSFTTYSSYLGSAIEVILLSIALADRINTLRKEKEESQLYALKISRENEKLIKEQNIVLEQKVTERTNELQTANTQLTRALGDLKDTQIQLVEAEKMASLGQLTAGIAHEINNPINFVKSNIKPLRMDIDDIFEIMEDYNRLHHAGNDHLSQNLNQVYEKAQALDMEFVKAEIRQLLNGIEDGAERTAEIVRGLKTFSRLDEGELKTANVHDGIESTLVLLRNSMPKYIRIERKFCAKGEIECFPGKLNQVFMNIINNSIQAVAEKRQVSETEIITISTVDRDDGCIRISIRDTGVGMSEEVKHRIFEPFFTTKPVGEGTGLGMAIVFKIIEEHHGRIEVISEPGKGAEFIITLPHVHTET